MKRGLTHCLRIYCDAGCLSPATTKVRELKAATMESSCPAGPVISLAPLTAAVINSTRLTPISCAAHTIFLKDPTYHRTSSFAEARTNGWSALGSKSKAESTSGESCRPGLCASSMVQARSMVLE